MNPKKICNRCKHEKRFDEFGMKSHAHDGLQPTCKECVTEGRKRSKAKNPSILNKFGSKQIKKSRYEWNGNALGF